MVRQTGVMRLLNHLVASERITGTGAKSCRYRRTRHNHNEREQHDSHRWKPLVHSHRL
jgi:hypothetical protein